MWVTLRDILDRLVVRTGMANRTDVVVILYWVAVVWSDLFCYIPALLQVENQSDVESIMGQSLSRCKSALVY